jgi:hypothetical protein
MIHPSHSVPARRIASIVLVLGVLHGPAMAAEGLNPDADEILRGMTKFIAGAKAFSVTADIGYEVVTKDGQKLQMLSTATVILERPSRFHITRRGKFADAALFFDGKKLTLHGKSANAYLQKDLVGGIDDALDAVERGFGIPMPASDLLLSNPYAALTRGVTSSGYFGLGYVGGVQSHHLAFRTPLVDWQMWVKAEGDPLPMKYVITTKDVPGSPQFSVQFSDWNLKPKLTADRFTFVAPKGTKRLEAMPIDEMGEIKATQENK